MKHSKLLATIFISTIMLLGCNKKSPVSSNKPQEVIITGQILNKQNYLPNTIAIIINDVATGEQMQFLDDLDEEGNFEVKFERYYPQEVMLKYSSIWSVFVHPGDSIHIQLDYEKMSSNEDIHKALQFSGDAIKENMEISMFNAWFVPMRMKESNSKKEENRYSPEQYIVYRDSLRNDYHQIATEFIVNNKISEPISKWIHYEIEHDYFHNLVNYPRIHRYTNNYPKSWDVPDSYYDFFEDTNFDSEFKMNSQFATSFVNECFIFYVRNQIKKELIPQGLVKDTTFSNGRTAQSWKVENLNSVFVDGITKFSPRKITQFILNQHFISQLRHTADIELYEKYLSLINKEITEPFLLANLQKSYKEIREASTQQSRINIIETKNNAGTEILKQIISNNKGKVIYVDCWAIWCGPCLVEMPNSRKLMTELKDENVEFVFLCCNSPKDAAKRKVEDLKLGGTHYFLNNDQTNYIQKELSFSSYPNYVLIDKKGNIVESSTVNSPGNFETKKKIMELINE